MTAPFSIEAIASAASSSALFVASMAYVTAAGLRAMSGKDLLTADRRLIGRYMLVGMLAVALMNAVVILWSLRGEWVKETHAMSSAFAGAQIGLGRFGAT